MLKEVGKESEYKKEELKALEVQKDYSGKVTNFPKVEEGWHVACAYNQWGMEGTARMIICETLDDMKQLINSYNKGGALRIDWYAIPDTHFVKIISFDEWADNPKSRP